MTCVNRSGKLRYLRINDLDNASGAPDDAIHEAVTAALVDATRATASSCTTMIRTCRHARRC